MQIRATALVALILAAACGTGSSDRPANIAAPTIAVAQANTIFFGSGRQAPLTLEVLVKNNATVPLTVRRVRLDATGMTQYSIYPVERNFNQVIPPGDTQKLTIFATAYTNVARLTPNEPLSVRSIVGLESQGARFQEVTLQNAVSGY